MKPKGKCFAKKCKDCNWWDDWDLTVYENGNPTGLRKIEKRCSFRVLMNEIPRLVGSLDGLQGGVNEARNASLGTQEVLIEIGSRMKPKQIRGDSESIENN